MPTFNEVFSDIGQGAGDVARAAQSDIQGTYWNQFMGGGRPPSPTPLTGDMEYTTGPQEAAPQSYGAALREYSDNEQAEIRARHEARQADEMRAQDTDISGAQPWLGPQQNATAEAAPTAAPGLNGETLAPEASPAARASAFDRLTSHHVTDADYTDISGQQSLPAPNNSPSQEDSSHAPEL